MNNSEAMGYFILGITCGISISLLTYQFFLVEEPPVKKLESRKPVNKRKR